MIAFCSQKVTVTNRQQRTYDFFTRKCLYAAYTEQHVYTEQLNASDSHASTKLVSTCKCIREAVVSAPACTWKYPSPRKGSLRVAENEIGSWLPTVTRMAPAKSKSRRPLRFHGITYISIFYSHMSCERKRSVPTNRPPYI